MPYYTNNPFQSPIYMQKGVPTYLLGSYDYKVSPTRMSVSNVVGSGSVATLTVQIIGGPIPTTGSLISVAQLANTAFNVSRAALTGVTLDKNGAGTITFASATSLSTTPDVGIAIVDTPEVGETTANGATIPASFPNPDLDYEILSAYVSFPSLPTTATVTLEGALVNQDAQYVNLGTVAQVTAGNVVGLPSINVTEKYNFFRGRVANLAGGPGTIVFKLMY
jgi:hypothetical protein